MYVRMYVYMYVCMYCPRNEENHEKTSLKLASCRTFTIFNDFKPAVLCSSLKHR